MTRLRADVGLLQCLMVLACSMIIGMFGFVCSIVTCIGGKTAKWHGFIIVYFAEMSSGNM